ncbi:DAK2 domain-containing protein [SAR202 cluster bacterium AD-804-J14_MRT_500m]|nr:DAK2 domain-containing protein [SAR202 cluster bacterium AD-804-J14_MRT_500m]
MDPYAGLHYNSTATISKRLDVYKTNVATDNTEVHRFRPQHLLDGLRAATVYLARHQEDINALNVFPVPDGDTGTNMLLTMTAVVHGDNWPSDSISKIAIKSANQAILGSRGNSGVILAQFLSGFSQSLYGITDCDGPTLARALTDGARSAYTAVSDPVEGTMLTVLRDLSDAAAKTAAQGDVDIVDILYASVEAAHQSLDKTPSLLPMLQEAGVVDSGGQGIVVFMEGLLAGLLSQDPYKLEIKINSENKCLTQSTPHYSDFYLEGTKQEQYGFCTQLILEDDELDLPKLKESIAKFGTSVAVIGGQSLAKIHVHTFQPEAMIQFARTLGYTSKIQVDNIDQQHQDFRTFHQSSVKKIPLGIVAVASGHGFADLFRDLGCHAVITCGHTMNPSTEELLHAARSTSADQVIILPNDANILLAANQAINLSSQSICCIPTTTMPQGIAALLAYTPDLSPEKSIQTMKQAIQGITTVEITTSHRNTSISGRSVAKGQIIGLINGNLVGFGNNPSDVLINTIQQGPLKSDGLITLYWGSTAKQDEAEYAAECLRKSLGNQEVEVVYGGQPFYHYIASIE